MQVLFEGGEEHGLRSDGVGALPGQVVRLSAPILPHMGWNTVTPAEGSALFAGVTDERFYFVHSYGVRPGRSSGETIATHGEPFVAAVEVGPLAATQFHPEKSGDAGLTLLENWLKTL
jgi:glutamine amidotransferase